MGLMLATRVLSVSDDIVRLTDVAINAPESVIVLDLHGNVTLGDGSLVFRQKIRELLDEGARNFLLNLSGVAMLDSSGIAELVSAYTAIKQQSGTLKLAAAPARVQYMLHITLLDSLFDSHSDEMAAIQSFMA